MSFAFLGAIARLRTYSFCIFMNIPSHIFRAYDIRGVYQEDLNEEIAELIGKGFGTYLGGNKNVVVGKDARTHSDSLEEAFVNGLISTGCHVTTVGLSPSPLLYFSNIVGEYDAGCNITASHNPPKYNGFKLVGKHGHSICGAEIQKILNIIESNEFISGEGSVAQEHYFDAYKEKLKSMYHFSENLTVVTDSGNGVTGAFFPQALEALGVKVIPLYAELDGTFPNHQPDPIVEENTSKLKETVLHHNADMGICFDGDGDRMTIIDEKGNFHTADVSGMLLARDLLTRHPGGKVVLTVSISESVFDDIRKSGGEAVMCAVGHSFVEQAMDEHNAILGVEQSGHTFVKENYYGYDDALVAGLHILALKDRSKKTLSELYAELPKSHIHPEIRPFCPDDKKFSIISKIVEHFKSQYECNTIDGVRIKFGEQAWAGIRASNTSPRISICLDAPTEEKLTEIKKIIMEHLESYEDIDWQK